MSAIGSEIEEENMVEIFHRVVRVVKKYPFSKHLLFLDVISIENKLSFRMSVHSIVIKSEDVSNGFVVSEEFDTKDIHSGDVLEITGKLQDVSEDKQEQLLHSDIWSKGSVIVKISEGGSIKRIEQWDSKSYGLFSYEETNFLFNKSAAINSISSSRLLAPAFVLQAKNKSVEKTLELLNSLKLTAEFRESSITLTNSKDRLILGFETENCVDINELTKNELLSQALSRIYPVNYKSYPFVVHPHLTTALLQLYSSLEPALSNTVTRIQSYPRHVASQVVDTLPSVNWSPKNYSHVLSVVLVDAVWMVSLVAKEDITIGDIYENSNKFGNNSSVNESENKNDRVCKSINKLHEIMTRNNWIDREYCMCIDVGASPGGWSTYMARHLKVHRIISVDRGVMNIDAALMPPIEHWQQLGQDAIEKLRELNEENKDSHLLDLYCCDANIAPVLSTELLIKCAEYGLLSDNARFVLTLKNTLGKQKDWIEAKQVCMEKLENVFLSVNQVSLLANTPKETTVTGIYRVMKIN